MAVSTLPRPMIEPTDKSMPAVMITSVMPIEITPTFATCRNTSEIFALDRKILLPSVVCGDVNAPTTSSTISPR
jgi:hypothetical protein